MAIPTYDQFIEPLLRYLAKNPEGARSAEVYSALAEQVGLNEEDRLERLPSRQQPVHHNRIGWAHDRLKRAGLSTSARRGVWKLTEAGMAFAREHPRSLESDAIERLARVPHGSRLRPEVEEEKTGETPGDRDGQQGGGASRVETASPDERIEQAIGELNESVATELLELMGEASPAFFEQLVLDLLHALGYGTSRKDLQRVGRSGDGGIDGIISLDRLGLEKVYVQAKRWKGTVGRPDLQAFAGALAGRRAKKGVFITTGSYTREAREYAESVADQIVVVDGDRVASLMIEHGVGVTHKPIKVPQVDGDYFEGE